MLATERRARILELLAVRRIASTEELANELKVSVETIRRDINSLHDQHALHRVRGGATAAASISTEPIFEDRRTMNQSAKDTIAALAVRLVRPGQTLFLDMGTTAVQVARALAPDFHGVVATSSLLVAGELAGRSTIEVLVSGGRVRGGDLSCSNAQSVAFFASLNADIAFVSSGGVDAAAGLTDYHLDEVATRLQMLAGARTTYVLADSSKFGVAAPYKVCGWPELDGLISERRPPAPLHQAIITGGGRIITE